MSHILNVKPEITLQEIQVSSHSLVFTCIPTETFNSEAPAKVQSENPYKYAFFFKRKVVPTDEQELQINCSDFHYKVN